MPSQSQRDANSRGQDMEEQLRQGLQAAASAPLPGARDLPVIEGIDFRGNPSRPLENLLVETSTILAKSRRVYIYGDSIVMETGRLDGTGCELLPLRTDTSIESGAKDFLANVFLCGGGKSQFAPPRSFVDTLLRSHHACRKLPRINLYARRPVFDRNFTLCTKGFNRTTGVLAHGFEIEPYDGPPRSIDLPVIERLPRHLRRLLRGFCFRSDADLTNFVALLLNGLLVGHFTEGGGKPVLLLDGNQPELGKTLLARLIGIILDGCEPRLTQFTTNDEELSKRICASLRDLSKSVLLIDNARVPDGQAISSAVIEANSLAPEIAIRILGQSVNFVRPNDVTWIVTMNNTRASADLISRSAACQLYFEESPTHREFAGFDPLQYARDHRADILGELAGMVIRWNHRGRQPGHAQHRCREWAATIGGILEAANLPRLLQNAAVAAASFDTSVDELAALAETVIAANGPFVEL